MTDLVASPERTSGKTFERLLCNDKLSAREDYSIPIYSRDTNNPP